MGNILMTGSGGGGAGSDDCTATAAELLKGYTGILKGSDDEPVQGILELTGNAQAAHVLNGETFYTNNAKSKQTGTMPNRGDYNGWGNSKGNDAGNQRMWVKVPQGYYNENANVFLSWADIRNMAGITADKIKKNEPIMGIIGSFEGWVPEANDLYLRGNNPAGFTAVGKNTDYVLFLSDRIQSVYHNVQNNSGFSIQTSRYYDFAKFNTLTLDIEKISGGTRKYWFELCNTDGSYLIRNTIEFTGRKSISMDIRNVALNFRPMIYIRDYDQFYMPDIYIFQIRLST